MPTATRTFRVFVSSTFEDLKEERNALGSPGGPFAELTKVCQSFGARFQAIDLRWGVREEAGHDQRTMEICLGEIERCQRTGIKPNFIILLGDRYGWRPLPARIMAEEFRAVRARIADANDRELVDGWYQLDENAVPSEYLLKARAGEFTDTDRWAALELAMHKALREGARAAGLRNTAMVKYEASATHQEILKGLGKTAEDRAHVFAFFRTPQGPGEDPDLTKLKQSLREQLKGNVFMPRDTADLCERVRQNLERSIQAEARKFTSRRILDVEVEAHDAFAHDRARYCGGREDVLRSIGDYLKRDDRRPMVVNGASGSGKSAVMARASKVALDGPGNVVVIRRFIGATPESSSGITLLRSLCEQIGQRYGVAEGIPVEFDSVISTFGYRLALATADRPLVLFIDALDQIAANDPAADINWLTTELPPHCRVVLSTTDVARSLEGARRLELEVLPVQDAEEAVGVWLDEVGRKVQDGQREKVLSYCKRCGLPLYLKLVFEEVRRWRSFDVLEACELGEGLAGIIDVLLRRLSSGADHGRVLVSHSLGYLAAGRYGLTEDELLEVLTQDKAVWGEFDAAKRHDPPSRRLPDVVWARLFQDLEPYLTERALPGGTTIDFFHRQMPLRLASLYRAGDDLDQSHELLARYFERQPLWFSPSNKATGDSTILNKRKLFELPFQQTCASLYPEVEETLSDLCFLEGKCLGDMSYDLLDDCDRASAGTPLRMAAALHSALSSALPGLIARPAYTLQSLYNRLVWLEDTSPVLSRRLEEARGILNSRGPWIHSVNRPARAFDGNVNSFPLSPQSLLQSLSGLALATATLDGDVKVQRVTTGQAIFHRKIDATAVGISFSETNRSFAILTRTGCVGTDQAAAALEGRTGERLVVHTGHEIIAARRDDALVAWNPDSGDCIVLANGVPKPLVVLRKSGGGILSVAGHRTQRLGITRVGEPVLHRELSYPGEPILAADLSEDGSLIAMACLDHRLKIVDARSGEELATVAYEKDGGGRLHGAPEHCVFGRGALDGCVVFATSEEQIASWNWRVGAIEVIDDCATGGSGRPIILMDCLQSGQVLVSSSEHASLLSSRPAPSHDRAHSREVTAIGLLDSGETVSFSRGDHSVVWHSSDPLQPAIRRVVPYATAMTVSPTDDCAVIGDGFGRVWKQKPHDNIGPDQPAAQVFAEPVQSICPSGSGMIAVAAPSGTLVTTDLHSGVAHRIRLGTGLLSQRGIAAAGQSGICWSFQFVNRRLGLEPLLSLLNSFGWGKVRLRVDAKTFSTCQGGNIVCYADGQIVKILRRWWLWLRQTYSTEFAAEQVAFLENTGLLALVRSDDRWLEIRQVTKGLPVIAAIDLPDEASCIAATTDRVALGFKSGDVMSIRLIRNRRDL